MYNTYAEYQILMQMWDLQYKLHMIILFILYNVCYHLQTEYDCLSVGCVEWVDAQHSSDENWSTNSNWMTE